MKSFIKNTEYLTKNDLVMKRVCVSLFGLILCVSVAYGYLINQTIENVVVRQKAQTELSTVNSRLAELEAKHIALASKINLEYAHSLGFIEVTQPEFVSYVSGPGSLSLNALK